MLRAFFLKIILPSSIMHRVSHNKRLGASAHGIPPTWLLFPLSIMNVLEGEFCWHYLRHIGPPRSSSSAWESKRLPAKKIRQNIQWYSKKMTCHTTSHTSPASLRCNSLSVSGSTRGTCFCVKHRWVATYVAMQATSRVVVSF